MYSTQLDLGTNFNVVESILEICDIDFSDHGDYICTAENGAATSNTTIRVTVLEGMLHDYSIYINFYVQYYYYQCYMM